MPVNSGSSRRCRAQCLGDVAARRTPRSSALVSGPVKCVEVPTTPTAPTASSGRVMRVVAGVVGEVGAADAPRTVAVRSPLASLTATIRSCSASRTSVSVVDRHAGAVRDVVEHHRQAGGVGDRGEVPQQAGLRRLVVVRRDHEQAVRAGLLGARAASSIVCRVSLVPTPATTLARSPTASTTARTRRLLLGVGGGRRLAGGAVDHQPVVALLVDQVGGERGGAVEVERAVGGERRHHRGEQPAERRGAPVVAAASMRASYLQPSGRPPVGPAGAGASGRSAYGLAATSVPSGSVVIVKSANTFGATPWSCAQALDGQLADLHVGVLGGPHRDEVPPGPVVAGDDDPGLGGVGQHRAGRLPGLLAAQRRVGLRRRTSAPGPRAARCRPARWPRPPRRTSRAAPGRRR